MDQQRFYRAPLAAAFGLAAAALSACAGPTAPAVPRVVGVIAVGVGGRPRPPAVPDTVRAGVVFTIEVVTYGSGTCTRPDGATVRVTGAVAEVTPYDRDPVRAACTDDLRAYPRLVALRFEAAGEAIVRVRGRASHRSDSTVTVEARVLVR